MTSDLTADEKSQQLNDLYQNFAAKVDALIEKNDNEAKEAQLNDINQEDDGKLSNFSASFYGPLFEESEVEIPIPTETEPEPVI